MDIREKFEAFKRMSRADQDTEMARLRARNAERQERALRYPEDYEIADCGCAHHAEEGIPCPHDKPRQS